MVQGPVLGVPVSGSLEVPQRMLSGRLPALPKISFAGVDTRDVVELHVRALTDPQARGERIIAAAEPLWMREIAQLLKARFGARASKVSTREAADWLKRKERGAVMADRALLDIFARLPATEAVEAEQRAA